MESPEKGKIESNPWYPIELDSLKYFSHTPVSLYVELRESEKYVKVLEKNSAVSHEFIFKFRDKNVSKLFVELSDKDKFCKKLEEILHDYFTKKKKKSYASFLSFEDVHKKTHTQMVKVGFNESTVNLAMASASDLHNTVSKSQELSRLLKFLKDTEGSFQYRLNYMTSIVSQILIKKFSWSTPQILKSALYASMFSDIGLNDEMVKIRSEKDMNRSNLSKKEKEKVYYHAIDNSKMLSEIASIPDGVAILVKQHHGQNSGVGFSSFITNSISNIALCLMISEEFSFQMLIEEESELDLIKFADICMKKFGSARTKEICCELMNCLSREGLLSA